MIKIHKRKKSYQEKFNDLLNKRSRYLKSLLQENINSKKVLTTEKEDILMEKLYNYGKFDRDYSVFSPQTQENVMSRSKSKTNKLNIFPELRVFIVSPEEKAYPDKYKKKEYIYDDFSKIYKNSSWGLNNKKVIECINRFKPKKNINKNDNNSPFLTNVGSNIVSMSMDQENMESKKRNKLILPSIV